MLHKPLFGSVVIKRVKALTENKSLDFREMMRIIHKMNISKIK